MRSASVAPRAGPPRTAGALPALLLVLLLGASGPVAGQETSADTSTSAEAGPVSLYTEEQADRGETAFRTNCAACHLPNQFRGGAFRARLEGRTAYDLVDQLQATMPMDNPGGLSVDTYVDVTAYFLRLNRFEPGPEELPADEAGLRAVRIPPDGADEEGG